MWRPACGAARCRRPPTLADHVLRDLPIGPLYALAQEVHCLSSLAGFEALLRGLRVVTWGRPFYAGWGLTEDHDPPPRRGRPLTLDALVAGALILHLRCIDPLTGLPCPPELLVERLAEKHAAAADATDAGAAAGTGRPLLAGHGGVVGRAITDRTAREPAPKTPSRCDAVRRPSLTRLGTDHPGAHRGRRWRPLGQSRLRRITSPTRVPVRPLAGAGAGC